MENAKRTKWLGLLGITLCGLCCALPIIGTAIGMASLATIAFYLEKVGFAAIGLAFISLLFVWHKSRTKKTTPANSCSIDCECKTKSLETTKINK